MANRKLSPEELAELVNSTPETRKSVEDLGKSAVFSTLGDFLKEPTKDELSRVHVKWNAGLEMIRPTSTSTSTIQGRSANSIVMDEYGDTPLAGVFERMAVKYEAKLEAERRAAEERRDHYKGDPLAGTF